ncbi:Phosphoglucosamine mutase [Streptomyces tendae]
MQDVNDDDLLARAKAWLAEDPDADTRAELARLIDAEDLAELTARFSGTLQFGTAGLRGELGAGPMRMNRSVVIRAAAGLAAYLKKQGHPDGLVVVGYDARHKSEDFARDTAAVMTGAGLRAAVLPRPLPTPVLAFAIRHLGAVAGVEVTASHNPPRDNGYKVYLGDGSQIVPPADADIAAEIDAVRTLHDVPRPDTGWQTLADDVLDAYLTRTDAVLAPGSPRTARTVYTAMHGVGKDTLLAAFARAGFPPPALVTEQADPDPDLALGGRGVLPRLPEVAQLVHDPVALGPHRPVRPLGADRGPVAARTELRRPHAAEQTAAFAAARGPPVLLPRGLLASPQRDGHGPQLVLVAARDEDLVGVGGPERFDLPPGEHDHAERIAHPQPVLVREDGGPHGVGGDERHEEDQHRERLPAGAPLAGDQGVDAEPQREGEEQHASGDACGRAVDPVLGHGFRRLRRGRLGLRGRHAADCARRPGEPSRAVPLHPTPTRRTHRPAPEEPTDPHRKNPPGPHPRGPPIRTRGSTRSAPGAVQTATRVDMLTW